MNQIVEIVATPERYLIINQESRKQLLRIPSRKISLI